MREPLQYILVGAAARGKAAVTLVAVCLTCALLASCGVTVVGDDPPLDEFYGPVGMALHPTGKYLYVVNSNNALEYREDRGGSVVVVDTDRGEIVPGGSVQIGSFGGSIALNSPANGEPSKAYVAVRGDSSLTVLDLEGGGASFRCKGETLSAACRLVLENGDPFGLAVTTTTRNSVGDDAAEPMEVDFVSVAHLLGSQITGVSLLNGDLRASSLVTASLVAGANDVALSARNNHFYATSRFTNTVVSFRPVFGTDGHIEGLFRVDEVEVENAAPYNGVDSRGIAFGEGGKMAYVANRGPDSLLFMDIGPTDAQSGSGSRNQIVDSMVMPAEPSDVAVVDFGDEELIYVTAYNASQIMVVDPKTRTVVETIEMSSPPYEMVIDSVRHKRIYASLFEENAVAVIDIDPESASFNQVISVIQ